MSRLDDLLKGLGGSMDVGLPGKPGLTWVDSYVRANGGEVVGHLRTHPNETTLDNLGVDADDDGIPGYLDADADGDGLAESFDLDDEVLVDALDVDGDGIVDVFLSLGDRFH